MSCYFTPNEGIHDFQERLDRLEDILREWGRNIIIAGDFNTRVVEWGMSNMDSRGKRVLELAAWLSLSMINVGKVLTFRRPNYAEAIPDITLASESLAAKIVGWKVSEEYTGSHTTTST